MRTAGIDLATQPDRTAAEVYPAATLCIWNLPWIGYKRAAGRDRLPAMVAELVELAPNLPFADGVRAELEATTTRSTRWCAR